MKQNKRCAALLLAAAMILSLAAPALAADDTADGPEDAGEQMTLSSGEEELYPPPATPEPTPDPETIWDYTVCDGGVQLTGIKSVLQDRLELPETLGGLPVVSVGGFLFSGPGGYSMKTVVISSSVTEIAPTAFGSVHTKTVAAFEVAEGNTAFEAVDGVLYTAGQETLVAYPQARANASYALPDSVKKVGDWAFYRATALKTLTLNEGLTAIGDYAFASSGLTGLRFPTSVTAFGSGLFDNCASFSEITLAMPRVPDKIFSLGKGLTSLTLEDTVQEIGTEAFSACDNLTSVEIPASVKVIGSSAFSGCSKLSSVTLHEGLTEIGHRAFASCKALQTIVLPNTLTTIRDGAFSGAGLTSLTIPGSVKTIEHDAFNGNALTEVTIPATVTEMGLGVFAYNKSLKKATVAEGVAALGQSVFGDCEALTEVSLPSTLTSIGSGAFSHCGKLESIQLPAGLTVLGQSAFEHSGLRTIQLPDGIQTLESSTFSWCRSLTGVQLPANLKKINSWAFEQCTAMQRVTIPAQVAEIENNAFYWCSALLEVVFEGDAPTVSSNPFHPNTGMVFYRPENASGYDGPIWRDLNFKIGPAVELEKKPIDIQLTSSLSHSRQDELILWLTVDITPRTYDSEHPIAPNGLVTTYIQVEGVDPSAQPEPIHYQGGNSSTFRTFGYNVEAYQGKTISVYVGMGESTGFLAGQSNTLTGPVLNLSELKWDEDRPFGGSGGAQGFETPELVTADDPLNPGCVTVIELDSRSASAQSVTIPGEIGGKTVTSLARNLFQNCAELRSVTLPASLKSIGANCFHGCNNLTEVTFLGDAPENLNGDSQPFPNDPILHIQPGAKGFDASPWKEMRREPVKLGIEVAYEFLNAGDITQDLLLQLTVTFDTTAYAGILPLVDPDVSRLTVLYGDKPLTPDHITGNPFTVTVPKGFSGGSLIVRYPGDRLFQAAQWYQIVYPPVRPVPVTLKSATYAVETEGGVRTLWLTPRFDPAVHPEQSVQPDVSKITATVDGAPAAVRTDGLRVGVALTDAQAGKTLSVVLTFPGDDHFLAAAPLTVSAAIPALPSNGGNTPTSGGSNGGGGSVGGGGSGAPAPDKVSTNDKKESSVSVSTSTVTQAVQEAAKAGAPVVLKADAPADAAKVAVTLPAKALKTVADSESKAVTLQTPVADIALDAKVLETIQGDGKQDVVVSAGTADTAALPKAAQEILADRPVYDISITSGGKAVSQFGGGTVTVALPYTPVDGEDESTLCVCWVKDDGSTEVVRDSVWKDGKAVFATPHLSTYAIVSRTDSFPDAETHWAGDDIRFSAVRGLLVGMEDGQFQPEAKVTGAMAVTVLGRLAGVADADEAADWAKPHLAWAEEHGYLPQGFDPDAPLPREQLAVLLALSLGGETGNRSLPAYTDQYDISAWALPSVQTVQALGLMQGREDGSFDPQGGLNRAELAAVLHRLVSLKLS